MRRRLTTREWVLLAILGVLVLVSGYILLFYNPVTASRDAALSDAALCRTQLEAAQLQLSEKRRMELELDEIFSQNERPVSLAPYDNIQPVMVELNTILLAAEDFSLTFGSVDDKESIVRRDISLSFTCPSYFVAKAILRQLHDSAYRCMVDGVTVSIGQTGSVAVSATLVYFEYHPAA